MTKTILLAILSIPWVHAETPTFPPAPPPRNEISLENRVAIPMRDGVVLYADVYRPATEGRYPVIVGRTPYGTERHATPVYQYPHSYQVPVFFAQRGYVFVYQDTRGRHESEGKWEPFRDDINDGYDTIEWAARQPWSNGKVGMHGLSYEGTVQWRAAMAAPPHLQTIVPSVASTSPYHDWVTLNGAWRLLFNFEWGAIRQESRITQNSGPHFISRGGPESISLSKVLWHLPLNTMQKLVGRNAQFYKDWMAHPDYDNYWKKVNAEEVFDQIGIPVLNFGGWFDLFRQGTLRGYVGMKDKGKTEIARKKTHLVIGPWGHWPSRKTGSLDFGETAFVDQNALALRWFDYWLKGIDNGVGSEPPVKLFVMGRNEWRYEPEYPLTRTTYRKMYFRSGGHANSLRGDGRLSWLSEPETAVPDRYIYDPDNPVRSSGGGADQRTLESRNDVLVYTSDFLEHEVEVTGPVKVVLYASSDAPDTDFVAKLIDVYPDGRAINIAEGILRARYRESPSQPKFLQPGKVYAFQIDLVGTSNVFLRGHRIRVDVTSSHFPGFDRHTNTREPFGTSAKVQIARQTVYHSATHPSHILLPVISTPR